MTVPITPASPPELCPDCQRPYARTAHQQAREDWCLYRESPGCRSRYVDRLRLEISKAQGEREHLEEARFVLWLMLNPNSEHPLQPSNWRAANWLKAEQELQAQAAPREIGTGDWVRIVRSSSPRTGERWQVTRISEVGSVQLSISDWNWWHPSELRLCDPPEPAEETP